jgi:hypothetical protein
LILLTFYASGAVTISAVSGFFCCPLCQFSEFDIQLAFGRLGLTRIKLTYVDREFARGLDE